MKTPLERIEKHIERIPECGCWIWTGYVDGYGYGYITILGKNKYTHRASWELHNGPIPKGMWVLHRCDTPSCINPHHLFLGTADDNAKDRDKKGRQSLAPKNVGENHPKSILTEEQVIKIRKDQRKHAELSKAYGVHYQTICNIKRGNTWKHLL